MKALRSILSQWVNSRSASGAVPCPSVVRGTYYPHVDGLRALAVMPVMLYHLLPCLCPGGYAGVDVFFVISGYLIAGGIVRDLETTGFSIRQFYFRRIRRIMPAYFVLIVLVLGAGCVLFSFRRLELLGESVLSSVVFAANVYFHKFTAGYFDDTAPGHPLLHLWSLSVEEQFYIALPVLLVITWRVSRKLLPGLLIVAWIWSFLLAVRWVRDGTTSSAAFYCFPARAWELLSGALIARMPPVPYRWREHIAAWGGIVLISIPYVAYTDQTVFPGLAVLPSVCGALLLIRYGSLAEVGSILSSRPFVWTGRMSYSLYLYHWPVLVFWNYCTFDRSRVWDGAGMLALAFVLGWCSWRWVELPVRRNRTWFTPRVAFGGVLGLSVVMIAVSVTICLTNGAQRYLHRDINAIRPSPFEARDPIPAAWGIPEVPETVTIRTDWLVKRRWPEHFDWEKHTDAALMGLGDSGIQPSFLVLGDSHAMALTAGIHRSAVKYAVSGMYLRSHISPFWGVANGWRRETVQDIMTWLERCLSVDTVIIANRWIRRFNIYHLSYQDYPYGPLRLWDGKRIEDETVAVTHLEQGLRQTCRQLKQMGKRVVVIGPVPETFRTIPEHIRHCRLLGTAIASYVPSKEEWHEETRRIMPVFSRLTQDGLAEVVYVHEALTEGGEFITQTKEGVFLYADRDHLSPEGACRVMDLIEDTVFGGIKGRGAAYSP